LNYPAGATGRDALFGIIQWPNAIGNYPADLIGREKINSFKRILM
jgi:hypothetical protein